jgi:Zn-dependent protease with chaperone function
MYLLAHITELPVVVLRMTFFRVLSEIAGSPRPHVWECLALIPLAWSRLALVTPVGGGWLWKRRIGGRDASSLEQRLYRDAVELLEGYSSAPLPLPASWFVLDSPGFDGAVCGETLMLSRGLLYSKHLPAVLAHILGHLATTDGRLIDAINRLLLWTPDTELPLIPRPLPKSARFLRWALRRVTLFCCGALGLYATSALWARYWREREFKADDYAVSLGQGLGLAEFLEHHDLGHDHPMPLQWLGDRIRQPREIRVERLRSTAVPTRSP